jgi:hypothetical protein
MFVTAEEIKKSHFNMYFYRKTVKMQTVISWLKWTDFMQILKNYTDFKYVIYLILFYQIEFNVFM